MVNAKKLAHCAVPLFHPLHNIYQSHSSEILRYLKQNPFIFHVRNHMSDPFNNGKCSCGNWQCLRNRCQIIKSETITKAIILSKASRMFL